MRTALIGAGKIAAMHVSAVRQAGAEVVAVCDRDEQRARQVAGLAPGARVFTDATEMLADVKPDIVHVLTPPSSHQALAVAAARAGVHALVEKPMALALDEADAMIEAAASHGVQIVPNHNYLYKPSVRRALELLADGALGEVVHVDAYYGLSDESSAFAGGAHWALDLPGGIFTNFLPHIVYLQAAFLGARPQVAGVSVAAARPGGDPSELAILLQAPTATGTMIVTGRSRPYTKFIRVYGTKGMVHADLVGEVTTLHRTRRIPNMLSKALFNLESVPQLVGGTAVNSAKVLTGAMRNMPDLHAYVAELYRALEAGTAPPATAEDGRLVVEVMQAVWERMPPAPQRPVVDRTAPADPPRTDAERRVAAKAGEIAGPVLVTGAAGYLGRHVAAALRRCGVEVRALVRDPTRAPDSLRRDAEIVIGNLTDPASLATALQGVGRVVHCAAVTTNNVAWSVHQETNVDGTRAVLDAAREAGVKTLVHVSSVIVYGVGESGNGALTEDAPYAATVDPWGYYLRSKLEADRMALGSAANGGPAVTVVRPGIIFGPDGAEGPVRKGLVQLGSMRFTIGRGANPLPLVYVDNVVDGILLALITPQAAGQAYNLVDDPQLPAGEIARKAIDVSGETTRLVPVPAAPLTALAARLEANREPGDAVKPPKLSRFQLRSATRALRYDTAKARRDLGWAPGVSVDEGLRRTIQAPL